MEKALLNITRFNNSDVIATSGAIPTPTPTTAPEKFLLSGVRDAKTNNLTFTGKLPYYDDTKFAGTAWGTLLDKDIDDNPMHPWGDDSFNGYWTWDEDSSQYVKAN